MCGKKLVMMLTMFVCSVNANTKVLTYCSEGDPATMSPLPSIANTTFDATSRQMYNSLVYISPGTTEISPGLAYSWTSVGNREYYFNLRRGVKFHTTSYFKPTRDFNADDVVFSINRQLLKSHPFHNVGGGKYQYFYSMGMDKLIKRVEKINRYKVLIKLAKPDASILSNLAMDFSSIFSKEYAEYLIKTGRTDLIDSQPIGTGPFIYENYVKNEEIVYRSNKRYWRNSPIIDKLVFKITPDGEERYKKFVSGECDMMAYPMVEHMEKLKMDKQIKMFNKPGLNVAYLSYNTTEKPFDNVNVRKALNMAIDRKRILREVYQGRARIAHTPIPPGMWSHNVDIKKDVYDPIRARKILDKIGVGSIETNIWIVYVQSQTNPNSSLTAEIIKENWSKIGVKAKIIKNQWKGFLENAAKRDRVGVTISGWISDNGDPDNFLYMLLSCDGIPKTNFAIWCYKPFDKLVRKAKLTNNVFERIRLYEEAQRIFKNQMPWSTLAYTNIVQPVKVNIKNYQLDLFGRQLFENLDIEK